MAHHNTVFVQLLRFLRRDMNSKPTARQHQRGQGVARHEPLGAVRGPWLGATDGADRACVTIVSNLSTPRAQALVELGRRDDGQSRSSLARVNAELSPYTLYETAAS